MYLFIPIDTEIRYKHVAWSGTRCPHCEIYEALRVDEMSKVILLFWKAIHKRKKGLVARCDLCERPLPLPPNAVLIPVEAWHRSHGLASLFDLLAPDIEIQISDRLSETTMQSLLTSVSAATSLGNMHIIPLTLLPGGFVGLAVGILLGMLIYDKGWVTTHFDRFGFVALIGLIGFVLGALLGAAWYAVLRGRKLGSRMILKACTKYEVDLTRLELLAANYPPRVRMVVRKSNSPMLPLPNA